MYPLGKTVCYMLITHIAFTKEGNQIHPTFEKCGVSLFSLPSSANDIGQHFIPLLKEVGFHAS
jgi:hypothetical protein